jgi:hypothetical protein
MFYFKLLFVASGVAVTFACVLAGIALYDIENKIVPGIMSAAAFLAATAGWLFSNAVTGSTRMRDKTFSYLNRITFDRAMSANSTELSRLWKEENIDDILVDEIKLTEYFIENYSNGRIINLLKELGNVFEEMALAVKFKSVDEAMLFAGLQDYIGLYLTRLSPFLKYFRNIPLIDGHPYGKYASEEIFAEVIWLGRRWAKSKQHF